MLQIISSLLLLSASVATATTFFSETFDDVDTVPSRWVVSSANAGEYGTWSISNGKFYGDAVGSTGLKTMDNAKFYSLSVPFDTVANTADSDFVVQFSVKHEQSIDCGGGYVKLLPPSFTPEEFNGESEYGIMFGPDHCGTDNKVHAILSFAGKNEQLKNKIKADKDQLTHLYTFILKKDKTYIIMVDGKEKSKGKLIEEWNLLPTETIKDPEATKPEDWVDEEMMDDPEDIKPAGYDDVTSHLPDPDAIKPEDWDEEEDGEFEPPQIPNPDYKGPYISKRVTNPGFKGKWEHPVIPNPDYNAADAATLGNYEIGFLGLDLWQVKSGSIFDDFLVTDDIKAAEDAAVAIKVKQEAEVKAKGVLDEEERKIVEAEEKQRKIDHPEEDEDNEDMDMEHDPHGDHDDIEDHDEL